MRTNNTSDKLILDLKNKGFTNQQIADATGVNISTVVGVLKRHPGEYKHRGPGRYQKINLTEEQLNYIADLRDKGYSLNDISNKTGYSKSFIFKTLGGIYQ